MPSQFHRFGCLACDVPRENLRHRGLFDRPECVGHFDPAGPCRRDTTTVSVSAFSIRNDSSLSLPNPRVTCVRQLTHGPPVNEY